MFIRFFFLVPIKGTDPPVSGTDGPFNMPLIATVPLMAFIVRVRADLLRHGQNIGPPTHHVKYSPQKPTQKQNYGKLWGGGGVPIKPSRTKTLRTLTD